MSFFFLNHGPEKYTSITRKNIYVRRGQRMRWREAGLRYTCNIYFRKKKQSEVNYDKNLNIINLND